MQYALNFHHPLILIRIDLDQNRTCIDRIDQIDLVLIDRIDLLIDWSDWSKHKKYVSKFI